MISVRDMKREISERKLREVDLDRHLQQVDRRIKQASNNGDYYMISYPLAPMHIYIYISLTSYMCICILYLRHIVNMYIYMYRGI